MRKYTYSFLACLLSFQSAYALLPPLFQSAEEIKGILSSEKLGKALESGEVIVKIRKNDNGYEIITNHQRVQVDLDYKEVKRPGPSDFTVNFHKPEKVDGVR